MGFFKVAHLLTLFVAYLLLILPNFKIIPYPLGEYTSLEWAVFDQLIVLLAFITSVIALLKNKYSKVLSIFLIFLSLIPFILVSFLFIDGVFSGNYHLDYLSNKYFK
ncbi:MAG: hypothetical protein PHQ59_02315 [Candidatus Daviesbacteria bacterium]|nr:hypothetical protein [Candidatus Daviesbacteria bacterium]